MTDLITKIDALYEKATKGRNVKQISMRGEALLEIGDCYNKPSSSRSLQMREADASLIVTLHNAWPAIRDVLVVAKLCVSEVSLDDYGHMHVNDGNIEALEQSINRLNGGE